MILGIIINIFESIFFIAILLMPKKKTRIRVKFGLFGYAFIFTTQSLLTNYGKEKLGKNNI